MSEQQLRQECDIYRAEAEAREKELVEERRQLAAMSAITTTAISTLDLQEMLDAVLATIVETLETSAASVLLLEDDDRLVATASVGLEEEVRTGFHLTVGEGFGGMVAKERRPLYSPNVGEDIRIRSPILAQKGIRTLLGVPLLRGEELVGVLRVGWADEHPYDQNETDLLQLAADRFALAITNAKLFETQAEIAETLQAAMLTVPDHVPGVVFAHLYESASVGARVGGDFYDVFELPDDRVGIVIGDVSGHGLKAAALTAVTKTALKAYALEYDSPARIMRRTNEVLFRESDVSVFVTAFIALLDVPSGRMLFCNAGHPAPLVCKQDTCAEHLAATHTFLGAFEGVEYEDSESTLGEGELLFLYTDGVLEARGASGDFYGSERLRETLQRISFATTADIPRKVYQDVLGFAGGKLSDDVALLAVRPAPLFEDDRPDG